jgi:hypothetical protein
MTRFVRVLPFAMLSLAALSLAACSDSSSDNGSSASTTSPRPPTTTGRNTTTSTAFVGALTPVSTPRTEYRYLKAVRVGAHDGFDRVVFEFESGVPGYAVNYVDRPVTEDGSGKDVTVNGAAILRVRMESASGTDQSGAKLRQTYTGATRVAGAGGSVVELVRTGDFEAVLTWVIGVRGRAPFHAYPSEGNKLVIDVAR